jgi:GNAT superfamily N-acetyltransferase
LIQCATLDDAAAVSDVLTRAAAQLAQRGHALWGESETGLAAIQEHVRAGMYFLARDGEGPVGVFRFQLEDFYFWPEISDGSSAFIHKLAVHPRSHGRGVAHQLLSHACELTRQHGRRHLRLDCRQGRPKLNAVYESFGFRHHSSKQISDQFFERYEFEV